MQSETTSSVGSVRQYFEHPPRSLLYVAYSPKSTSSDPAAISETATTFSGDGGSTVVRADGDVSGGGGAEGTAGTTAKAAAPLKKALSPLLLTGLMYTFTIGGAYGIEETVLGGGPFLAIISIILIPIIMAGPSALVVAELASAVPSNAGFLMWINLSFHRVAYLTMCLLSLLLIFIDNALYPVLFSEYVCTTFTCNRVTHAMLPLGMVILTFVLNLLGIEAVGIASVVLTVVTVSPFVLMFLIQQFSNKFYLNWKFISYIPASVDWVTFITTASWNLSGLEQAGAVAEEIQNPQSTIIQALIPLLGLACMTYAPPILIGASTGEGPLNLDEWQTGYWSDVSFRVGGQALRYMMIVGSILSAFGLTLAAICTTTSLIGGMAQTEVFPGYPGRWLSQRNKRFGSYHWALTVNTVLTALFSCLLDFGPLVKMDQFLYGLRVCMIFVAFFIFRRKYPKLHRPYRIPLDGWKLYVVFAAPTLSFAALAGIGAAADTQAAIICLSTLGGCIAVSVAYCFLYHKHDFAGRIVTVAPSPPRRVKHS